MTKLLKTAAFALTATAILLSAPATQAATITYNLTSDHCTGGCLTNQTSGGTVTITDGAAGTVSVNVSLLNGNGFVGTGLDATFGFNLSGDPTITYSGLPANWIVEGPNSPSLTEPVGSLHMDGTGFFEYGVKWGTQGGGNATFLPLNFTITGTGLTTASFQQNAAGNFFAVDIISGTTGNTGAIDASTPNTSVPDGGSTLTLLGSVLLGVGMLRRKLGK
jgi:hypothetical protein